MFNITLLPYNGFNSVMEKNVEGVNYCLVDMPKQTTDLSKALEQSNKELTSLMDSTLDKQSADSEQNIRINTI